MVERHENPTKEQIEVVAEVMWDSNPGMTKWNKLHPIAYKPVKEKFLRQVEL